MGKFKLRNLLTSLAAVAAVFFCSATVSAETFEAGGIFYNTTTADEVEVTRTTAIEGYYFVINIPESVVHNGKTYRVTAIGEEAFFDNEYLTEITFPKSVKVIKNSAFEGCEHLATVNFSEGLEKISYAAFYKSTSLYEIALPSTLLRIEELAFSNCENLTIIIPSENIEFIGQYAFDYTRWKIDNSRNDEVYLGKVLYRYGENVNVESYSVKPGTKSIASNAFYDNVNLKTLNIPASVVNIGDELFCENLNLINVNFENENNLEFVHHDSFVSTGWYNNKPDGEVYIGKILTGYKGEMPVGTSITVKEGTEMISDFAFSWEQNLESIIIPNSVKTIEFGAFRECEGLKSVVLPEGLKVLEDWVFENCSSLEEIKIPNSVEFIGDRAFWYCVALKKLDISANVKLIEEAALSGLASLDKFVVDKENSNYCAVDGILFSKDKKKLINFPCMVTGEYVIPEGIELNYGAFIYSNLKSVTIPASLTKIVDYAFSNCKNLENVVFKTPSRIKYIGLNAFYGCSALKSIILPDSLEFIDDWAFAQCSLLNDIKFPESLRSIYHDASHPFVNTPWIDNQLKKGIIYAGNFAAFYFGPKSKTIEFKEGTKAINHDLMGAYDLDVVKKLILPESVSYIGADAFKDLHNLLEVRGAANAVLENNVFMGTNFYINNTSDAFYFGKSVFPNAFGPDNLIIKEGPEIFNFDKENHPGSVKNLYIPKSIKTIAKSGFNNYLVEDTLKIDNVVPPVFEGDPKFHINTLSFCKLCVPQAAVETYKKSPYWCLFENIVGDPELSGVETVESADAIRVFADGSNIVIEGVAEGTPVEVFNLNGQTIYSGVESLINVADKGIYIVRVEGKAYKVAM